MLPKTQLQTCGKLWEIGTSSGLRPCYHASYGIARPPLVDHGAGHVGENTWDVDPPVNYLWK